VLEVGDKPARMSGRVTGGPPPDSNMIVSIGKQGAAWSLVLRNRFDVEVIVDRSLDLVSARQLTQPKDEQLPALPWPR